MSNPRTQSSRTAVVALGAGLLLTAGGIAAQSALGSAPTTTTTASHGPAIATAAVQPGSTNTGVPAGTKLTIHSGDISVTKAGTVLSGLDIRGSVLIHAANVVIKNSIIRGGAAPTHNHCILVDTDSKGTNLLVQDSEFAPTHVNVYQNNFCGSHFTANRINSHTGVDTMDINGGSVLVENSWFHGTTHYSVDPNHGGGPSHNDAIQVTAGVGIKIINNTISGGANSALMISQDAGKVSSLTMSGNYIGEGSCSVRIDDKPLSGMSGISLTSNRFSKDQTISGCAVLMTMRISYSASGNVWTDGSAVAIKRYG